MIRGDLTCPDCGGRLEYFPKRGPRQYPHYGCEHWRTTGCGGNVTAHKKSGEPMGEPANRETRRARALAHKAFDWLWESGTMTRDEAYRWLRGELFLPKKLCHIAMLDKRQCERVMVAVERYQLQRFGSHDKVPPRQMRQRGA